MNKTRHAIKAETINAAVVAAHASIDARKYDAMLERARKADEAAACTREVLGVERGDTYTDGKRTVRVHFTTSWGVSTRDVATDDRIDITTSDFVMWRRTQGTK